MKIGFVGLGTMGANAARNLRKAGFPLSVYDIRQAAIAALVESGAEARTSPADVLTHSDVVVTMVFGPKEIEQVLRGDGGFLSTTCVGKVWIDMTTSSPSLMRALAKEFEAKGGRSCWSTRHRLS